jgi:myosin heavy subunit
MQALYRGHATRRLLAAIRIETFFRTQKLCTIYRKLKSATIALQCAVRVRIACKEMAELKREQKDIGKLKQNNEKLKSEMASLKAMLAAQAQNDASKLANEKEMVSKQEEIRRLEKRVAELEEQLEREKALVKKLEEDLKKQKEQAEADKQNLQQHIHHLGQSKSHRRHPTPPSPQQTIGRRTPSDGENAMANGSHMRSVPENYVSPEMLEAHKKQVMRLEEELEAERKHRREADSEIIKLRASVSGVQLDDAAVNALLPDTLKRAKSEEPGLSVEVDEDETVESEGEMRYVMLLGVEDIFCFVVSTVRYGQGALL